LKKSFDPWIRLGSMHRVGDKFPLSKLEDDPIGKRGELNRESGGEANPPVLKRSLNRLEPSLGKLDKGLHEI
jgi:hypothetical protein